jgi:ribose transport system substrate-binding protein
MKKLVLILVVVLLVAGALVSWADKKVYLGVAIRTLANPYHASVLDGAKMFAASLPAGSVEVQALLCEGSDEKQINDIKAFVAAHGKDCVIYLDANQAPDAAEVARICEEAGVYWTSVWSMADGVTPPDYKYYVMHQSPDDQKSGYLISKELFATFKTPGKGKILAVQGMLANSAAINRFKGLQKALAEYPGVQLMDNQAGDWDPKKALTITETWLSKYKDLDGIWVANDGMAMAVIQALKAKGLNGKVKVVGVDGIDDAVNAIKAGDMAASVGSNPWLQGGFGLAYPYAAYKGKIDTKKMTAAERMFYTPGVLITGKTVADYEAKYVKSKPKFNYNDLKSAVESPMPAPKS